jgi:hypothetical protein
MATNSTSGSQIRWEVVDGLQRLVTLVNFAGSPKARQAANLTGDCLRLEDLEKLQSFDACYFSELPEDIRTAFEDRPFKVIILNDKSDLQVRYDLFERLNTGGIELTPQEIRECVYRGEFVDLLGELANLDEFKTVVVLAESRWKDGTPEDYVLRFFAYLERYERFKHLVKDFLRDFIQDAYAAPQLEARSETFKRTFSYLARCFPNGILTRSGQTPEVLYEALAVGAALALDRNPNAPISQNSDWISSDRLRYLTTGATNSKPRVKERIEYCRDRFLGKNV